MRPKSPLTCVLVFQLLLAGMETGAKSVSSGNTNQPAVSEPSTGLLPARPVLAWDSSKKTVNVSSSDTDADFAFSFTNTTAHKVIIQRVEASCGCTTLRLPPLPWEIAPGGDGRVDFLINVAGKSGTLYKTVTVVTDTGSCILRADIVIAPAPVPPPSAEVEKPLALMTLPATTTNNLVVGKLVAPVINKQVQNAPKMLNPDRGRNFQTAAADRQAVFKGDCVRCHVTPGEGKMGKSLYEASCGICHDSHNRATMVPDLLALKIPTDKDFWRAWITHGRPGSLMPAFVRSEGGPLTEEQVESLVAYLALGIPSHPNEFE